jgi:hypothetical protein
VQGDISATPPANTETIALGGDPTLFYRLEGFPVPPARFFSETFDSVGAPDLPEGWTTDANESDAGTTVWELGNTTGGAANGPATANSPDNCFGTNISSNYGDGTGIALQTPLINLTDASIASLGFSFFVDTPEGEESGRVNLKNADGTLIQEAFGSFFWGQSEGWTQFSMRLPSEALGKEVILEFEFLSGGNADHGAGWYIDDVVVDES